jgi:hypothetical protein
MLEKDPQQKYPTAQEISSMPGELLITPENFQSDAVDELLAAMHSIYRNGDARFVSFIINPHPVLDFLTVYDQLDKQHFWIKLLSSPLLLDQLPWLGASYIDSTTVTFEPFSAYYLDGDLAQTLMIGGAYERFAGTAEEAKSLGLEFCADVFANRYDEVVVRKSKDPWAQWFNYAPWDNTWLGLDRRVRRLWMLSTKDTD